MLHIQIPLQNLIKVYSYISMSLIPFRDLKFLRLLVRAQTKGSAKEAAAVRHMLNNEMIKFQPNNPFVLQPFPPVTEEQIPIVLLFMAKQMEEISVRNLSLTALENFVSANLAPLRRVLVREDFHCQIFCMAVMKYLQEYAKIKELTHHVDKMKLTPFLDLLIGVLESRDGQKIIKPTNAKDKDCNVLLHNIFNTLLFIASSKYIKQVDGRDILQDRYLEKGIQAACLMTEYCEQEQEFQAVREYLSIMSHLLIFNGLTVRPNKMLQFCLENGQGLYADIKHQLAVPPGVIDKYIRCLYSYSMLDPHYRLALLKIIRNLLILNIGNPILLSHFDVLLELIRSKVFIGLMKQVFDMLIQSQTKRNTAIFDEIFMRILNSGVDLMDDNIQNYTLMLAQSGEAKRKEQFVLLYYQNYQKSKRMNPQIINFIFEVYLDQELPLEKLELMVGKEAHVIQASNMRKIHYLIGQKRQNSSLRQLLSIIIEKRKETAFKVLNKRTSHPFITQDWLTALGNNADVYKDYLNAVVETLCGKSLEIYPVLININSCIVKIQGDYWSRSLEFYSIILKSAEQFDIYDEVVFRYMILLQALFGEKLSTDTYAYFSKKFCKIDHPEQSFLTFLEYLVRMLKNKSAMLLYLQALLEFHLHLNKLFFEKKLDDIFFLASLVEEEYFCLSTYSFESVIILYELSLFVKGSRFQEDYLTIMRKWSSLMSRSECKQFQYLFSFREIKKIYPFMKEQQMKEPSDRIKTLWDTVLKLIGLNETKNEYILMEGNKIVADWKDQETAKRGIHISGKFIRNTSTQFTWDMKISTKEKTYIITINSGRAIIEQETRQMKESKMVIKESNIKQLKRNVPENIDFQIKLESYAKKMKIYFKVCDFEVIDQNFEGNLMHMKLKFKDNAYLKNIMINSAYLPREQITIPKHINVLSRWEIKFSSIKTISSQSFGQKFDFQHAFCCIGEMLRYFSFVNLPFAYDILIRMSTKMIAFYQGASFQQMQVMMQVFDLIDKNYSSMKGRGKVLTPTIDIDSAKKHQKSYYYLYVSALLPKNFWMTFSEQTKKQLILVLLQFQKCQQFRKFQNKRILLFDQLLQLSIEQKQLFKVCEMILNNHELDGVLSKKFEKFVQYSQKYSNLRQLLTQYLSKTIQYLNVQNEQYLNQILRCKFLIINSQKQQQKLFKLCQIQSKINILHYHSQNPSFNSNGEPAGLYFIKRLIKQIDVSERERLISWLIVDVKLFVKNPALKYDLKKSKNQVNNAYLELLLVNRDVESQEDRNEIDNLIFSMLQFIQLDIESKTTFKAEFQKTFHSTIFIEYLKQITHQIISKQKGKIVAIYQLSMSIITKLQKKNFFEFMIKYRYYCSHDCKLLKALIQHESFKRLKLAHFSIFLQYIFQILLIIQQKSTFTLNECNELIISITQYLEFIMSSLQQKNVPKALFYNYPRLAGSKDGLHDTKRVLRRMKGVSENIKYLQLRGGIYFKCVLIIIKLMKINFTSDYSNLVEYFLFGPHNSYNKDPQIFKAPLKMPDLVSTSLLTVRQRSAVESYINDAAEPYKLYFNNEDFPIKAFNEETDLSSYIADYFLMNIAQFLQENSSKIDVELLDKYSNSFLRGISNQKIGRQLLIPSAHNFQISRYDDVIALLQQQSKLNRQRSPPTSPVAPRYVRRAQSAAFEDVRNFLDREADQYSPRRPVGRKKTQDYTLQIRKRIEIVDSIKVDCRNWYKFSGSKRISSYFSDKAKQIRIMELMHTHFVLQNFLLKDNSLINRKDIESGQSYLKDYSAQLKHERKEISGQTKALLEQKIRKVRKIHPYTSEQPPVLNIISNCLTNMTCPITLKITKSDYDIRRHNQSICMKYYLEQQPPQDSMYDRDDEFYNVQHVQIEESVLMEEVKDEEVKQAALFKERPYCQLVTREGSYFCEYRLEQSFILLSKKERPNLDNNLWYLKLGTPQQSLIKVQVKVEVRPEDVIEILYRRFNQTTNNSLEFFLKDGTSKFITFYRKQNLSSLIKPLQRIFKGVKIVKDPTKQFQDLKYSQKWIEGTLSNFDYLMLINKYSGRSYNDLGQYYVFPWILKNYSSEKIDLTDPDSYRDLSKPIGALNPQKLKRYISKYRGESSNPEKCLYGSHYSTSLFVFYYLVRLEPYSSLHRDMQKGSWDAADRLFSSMEQVWDSLYNESATSDIKECIPEFYYMPAFLRNIAHIDLGKKQCGSYVGDVELPPWAKSAQEFVVTMRAALESDYVSENLHLWIDLIFGKHQCSEQRLNVFHPYSYSDPEILTKFNSKNTREIEGKICQITYFGQCPIQLFKKQHKPKKSINELRAARSTYNIRSETLIPLAVVGEVALLPGWSITEVFVDNGAFVIQLKNVTKQEKQAAIIPVNTTLDGLKHCLQNLEDVRKAQNKQCEARVSINDRNQIYIGKEFLMDLDVRYNFSRTQSNQLWIACFGCRGIRIYNWQLQLMWGWEGEEVREVHLQATRLIFATPTGKLYYHSFLDRRTQEIVVFRDVCDMTVRVAPLPRLPNRDKNQINYRVLCIGDGQRVNIANITFEEAANYTSLALN